MAPRGADTREAEAFLRHSSPDVLVAAPEDAHEELCEIATGLGIPWTASVDARDIEYLARVRPSSGRLFG